MEQIEKEKLITWIRKYKRRTLNSSLKKCYKKGLDHLVTLEFVNELGVYQITYNHIVGEDVVVTLEEFFIDSDWQEVEIDRNEYPLMWHYPESLHQVILKRRGL